MHPARHPINDIVEKRFIAASNVVINVREIQAALRFALDMIRHDRKARIGIDGPMDTAGALDFNDRRCAWFEGNGALVASLPTIKLLFGSGCVKYPLADSQAWGETHI